MSEIKKLEQLVEAAAAEAASAGWSCGMRNLTLSDLERRFREAKQKQKEK